MIQTDAPPIAVEPAPIPNYPKKLFYRIQEAAEITGLKPHVLRYWESEFKQLAPEKDANDQRRYRQRDIDLVFQIKDLLYNQKFTIAGARLQIKAVSGARKREEHQAAARRPAPSRRAILNGIREELRDLMIYVS
jgi:DNA-binding transcriptional MerR regulator